MNRPEINVTPLIDVLLVLLIIFMIITPMKPAKIEAKIPQEPVNDAAEVSPLALVVTVDGTGRLQLNNEPFHSSIDEPKVLIARLNEIFLQREINRAFATGTDKTANPRIEKTVFIKAPSNLAYGPVASVVDIVRSSGATPVSLQIDRLDQ